METHVTVKGQIVIPASIRKKFGITASTRIRVDADEEKQQIILTPITREFVHSLRGRHKGKELLKALEREKQRERER